MRLDVTVAAIEAAATHDLRRRVLRDGDASAVIVWPGDDDPSTTHLGATDASGRLVGVSTWIRRGTAAQLRGMATEPTVAGQGVGTALLTAGLALCRRAGCDEVWANARRGALGFYTNAGFTVTGDEFVTPDTGLPHCRVHVGLH